MYYQKAVELKPDYTIAKIDVAYINGYQKKYDEAASILKKILEAVPDYYDVHWGLAWVYEQVEKFDEAISEHQKCIEIRPEWADKSYNAIGKMYFDQKKDYLHAKQYYQKAIEIRENENIYYDNMIQALDQLNDKESLKEKEDILIRHFSKNPKNDLEANKIGVHFYNIGKIEEAIPYYQKAIEINPDNNVYYENLGLAYEGINDVEKAEKHYLESLKHKEDFQTCNRLGILYYKRNQNDDTDKAIEYYQKAIKLSPENAVLYENLGMAYEQKQMLEEAEHAYIKAIEIEKATAGIEPYNANYHNNLGVFYFRTQQIEKAIEKYEDALALDPDNTLFHKNLAIAYEGLGKNEEAEETYLTILKKDPDNDDIHNFLGVLYYRTNQFEKAIKSYLKAVELNPQNAVYYQNLGLAYVDIGQNEQAEDAYLKSLKIDPKDDRCLNLAGVFYHTKRNDYKTASELYSQAIKINSKEPDYFLNLGDAYTLLNDNKQATSAYAKAEELQKVS
jgi:tetratricopeptide (TPR) repeat protein